MGLSLDEFQKGVASVGDVISKGTDAWLKISGKATAPAPTTQPAAPAAPASSGQTLTQGASGWTSIPPWLIVAGVVAIIALKQR